MGLAVADKPRQVVACCRDYSLAFEEFLWCNFVIVDEGEERLLVLLHLYLLTATFLNLFESLYFIYSYP